MRNYGIACGDVFFLYEKRPLFDERSFALKVFKRWTDTCSPLQIDGCMYCDIRALLSHRTASLPAPTAFDSSVSMCMAKERTCRLLLITVSQRIAVLSAASLLQRYPYPLHQIFSIRCHMDMSLATITPSEPLFATWPTSLQAPEPAVSPDSLIGAATPDENVRTVAGRLDLVCFSYRTEDKDAFASSFLGPTTVTLTSQSKLTRLYERSFCFVVLHPFRTAFQEFPGVT